MSSYCSSVVRLVAVLAACAFVRTARAEGTSAAAPEPAPARATPPSDTGETHTKDKDTSRAREHLRFGVLGGVGFPRPLAVEGLIKVERIIAAGVEYSVLPGITVSGVDVAFWAIAADLRVFPLANGFFVGLRAGHQQLGGEDTIDVTGFGPVHETLTVDTTFLNPRVGFLWTWEPGITLGIDAGAQFPVAVKMSTTLPAGYQPADQAKSLARSLGSSTLPTVDLLRIGFLL
jgi:hypothetical protein